MHRVTEGRTARKNLCACNKENVHGITCLNHVYSIQEGYIVPDDRFPPSDLHEVISHEPFTGLTQHQSP